LTATSYSEFDHNDPDITLGSVHETWDELRQQCPIGKSDAHGGMWVVTGYPEAYEILHKPEVFSSWPTSIPAFPNPMPMVPVEIDPPELLRYRALLAEPFSPRRVKQYTEPLRQIVNDLIDKFIEQGSTNICETMAVPLPTFLGTTMLGLPESDAPKLQSWVHTFVHESASNPVAAGEAAMEIFGYFGTLLNERKADSSGEDLITLMAHSEIDGERLSDEDLLGFCLFLLLAAIDTSQKAIGSIFWHLASDAELRQRIVADPSSIPTAVEEFLRYWGPVITARTATEDVQVGGADIKVGERVLLLLGAANRDSREFPNADQFIMERTANRHITFGGHAHRCLGSHIARSEIIIMLEEFLTRIPDFEIADSSQIEWSSGQVQGVVQLPITFTPGPKRSAS
jgi:cytochrome P450